MHTVTQSPWSYLGGLGTTIDNDAHTVFTDTSSTASFHSMTEPTSSDLDQLKAPQEKAKSRARKKMRHFEEDDESGFYGEDNVWYERPDVDEPALSMLCDIQELKSNDRTSKMLVDYRDGVCFPLGEGGRELLRACLNTKGCKGRQLQGASVPMLLQLANDWKLWNVAIRIKVERQTQRFSQKHDAFVKFKAKQSQNRKLQKKEQMMTDRDEAGVIRDIRFEDKKYLTLGKEGRERLRAHLRRMHDRDSQGMDALLQCYGFKYSELRNATVPQLLKMAHVCGIWTQVVEACRKQEQKRDIRNAKRSETNIRDAEQYIGHSPYTPVRPNPSPPNVAHCRVIEYPTVEALLSKVLNAGSGFVATPMHHYRSIAMEAIIRASSADPLKDLFVPNNF